MARHDRPVLVKCPTDSESIRLLHDLMNEAVRGELVGVVVVSLYPRSHPRHPYTLGLSGRAASSPTFASGAVGACQVLLHELSLEEAGLL